MAGSEAAGSCNSLATPAVDFMFRQAEGKRLLYLWHFPLQLVLIPSLSS